EAGTRYAEAMKGVPRAVGAARPKTPAGAEAGDAAIVARAYDGRAAAGKAGRAFVFTGGHLHASFAEEGYRRFLVNGILWSAGLEIPPSGSPVALAPGDLDKYLIDVQGHGD